MQVKLKEDDSSNRNCSSVNDSTQIDIKNITDKISSTIEIKMWRSLNQNIAPVFTAPNQNRFFSKEESIEDNKSPPDRIVSTFTNTTVPNIHQNAQNADMVMPNVGGKDFIRFHTTHPISGDGTTANSIITTPSRGAVVSRRRLLGREEVQQASPSKAVSTASRKPTKNRQSVVVHIEQPKRTSIDTPPVLSSHGDRRRVQTPLKSRNRNNINDRQKAVVETDTEITTKFAIKYVADLFSLSSALIERNHRTKQASKICRFLRRARQRRLCVAISQEGRRLLRSRRQHLQSLQDMDWEDRQRLRTAQRRLAEQKELARLLEEKQKQNAGRAIQPAILKLLTQQQPISAGGRYENDSSFGGEVRQRDGDGDDSWEKDVVLSEAEMNGQVPVVMTAARTALLSLCQMDAQELTKLREKSKHLLQFTRPFPPIRQRAHEYDS
eukprot:gene35724-46347_t